MTGAVFICAQGPLMTPTFTLTNAAHSLSSCDSKGVILFPTSKVLFCKRETLWTQGREWFTEPYERHRFFLLAQGFFSYSSDGRTPPGRLQGEDCEPQPLTVFFSENLQPEG